MEHLGKSCEFIQHLFIKIYIDSIECGKRRVYDSIDFLSGSLINPVGYWPWMASLGYENDKKKWEHECGATLVSKQHFITAAHCAGNKYVFNAIL
jgi:secreted trypsin-like serine protease